ncbi:glycoside hydrolase family 3 protein [Sphingobacterium chungjuense]|uniref:glycoside hydrolase family 3 protein n=1 Tax=Sphingobacterium chungjuense TaxID=2675553 RepID=UPI0014086720|nr:glycoside hydrolase family 3 protein [Sphingobacterium chungjuense]
MKYLFLVITCISFFATSNSYGQAKRDFVPFINQSHPWVERTFQQLTPRERIAQLLLIRAHTDRGTRYIDSVGRIVRQEKLGGLVVFQGGPVRHADMFNRYQKDSKVPLLITFDGEWGLGMRLADSTTSFPYQMTLGAIQRDELIYDMGKQVAKDFLRLGMHFNFAPVVDINNNPQNPVINFRSFGDNKENVTRKAKAYMDGMVAGGIVASLKHFPGHGDTDVDSHHDLPQLDFSKKRLDELELFPFRELIRAGAPAIMVAHMHIPALDNTPNIPSSISKKVVTDLLRNELGFQGLSVTDAMDMKGVTKFFPNGRADVMAIEAGNDLLEISENSGRAIQLIEQAIKNGSIKQADIDRRVKKVLATKYWLGLDKYQPVSTKNLYNDLNSAASKQLVQRLAEASITVLRSQRAINSFNRGRPTLLISVGINKPQALEQLIASRVRGIMQLYVSNNESPERLQEIAMEARKYGQVIVAIHDARNRPQSTLPLSEDVVGFIDKVTNKNTITIVNANPYTLNNLDVSQSGSIIMAYQNDAFMQRAAAKVLFKDIRSEGKLPVTISRKYKFGAGM